MPRRGLRFLKLGVFFTAGKSRAGTKMPAGSCCAGTAPFRPSYRRPRLSVSLPRVHWSCANNPRFVVFSRNSNGVAQIVTDEGILFRKVYDRAWLIWLMSVYLPERPR